MIRFCNFDEIDRLGGLAAEAEHFSMLIFSDIFLGPVTVKSNFLPDEEKSVGPWLIVEQKPIGPSLAWKIPSLEFGLSKFSRAALLLNLIVAGKKIFPDVEIKLVSDVPESWCSFAVSIESPHQKIVIEVALSDSFDLPLSLATLRFEKLSVGLTVPRNLIFRDTIPNSLEFGWKSVRLESASECYELTKIKFDDRRIVMGLSQELIGNEEIDLHSMSATKLEIGCVEVSVGELMKIRRGFKLELDLAQLKNATLIVNGTPWAFGTIQILKDRAVFRISDILFWPTISLKKV